METTPLAAKIDYALTEARVVLPGAQALFGFQLAIILTSGFVAMPPQAKWLHAAVLGLIAVATMLLIAPAAYHRIVFAGAEDPRFLRIASRLILVATIALALGLACDIAVVAFKLTQQAWLSGGLGLAAAVVLLGVWWLWPLLARRRR
jgi:hypothetical protein